MKKIVLALIAVAAATVGMECRAGIMEPGLVMKHRQIVGGARMQSAVAEGDEADDSNDVDYIPLIIKLTEADAELPDGVVEIYRRGEFVLAYVPYDLIDEIAVWGSVARIEGSEQCVPALDCAREYTFYPQVVAAEGLPQQFTGKDVVVGFSDIGFDPNHIEFRDNLTGLSRVKRLTQYGMSPDKVYRLTTPEEIAQWSTDNKDQWHATHVAGILAGNYTGNPYYGIATEADIVASTSYLYGATLLAGMEDVIAYAKEQGKPAVINMSVSESIGPHDGSSLFCQYLKLLSEDAVICISSGNDGNRVGHWYGEFPEDCSTAAAVVSYITWDPVASDGYIDVWSRDDSPFSFAVVVLDLDTEEVVARIEMPEITADSPETICAVASSANELTATGVSLDDGIISEDFAKYLSGAVVVLSEVNPDNNRFNALTYLDVVNLTDENGEQSRRYLVGLEVIGKKGQAIDAFSSERLRMRHLPGYQKFVKITTDGTINDFVTGEGVIGVGAMCSRNSWPMISGEDESGIYTEGDVTSFTSYYSAAPNGKLPDIVAPGAYLISSFSSPYLEEHPASIPNSSYMTEDGGKNYYWLEACGTSMSSPYLAGVCALMYQANPSVTPATIKSTVVSTATSPDVNASDLRWGNGILNSYEAIRSILTVGGVNSIGEDICNGLSTLPTVITISQLRDFPAPFSLYNLQGQLIAPSTATPGLYILHTPTASGKLRLRP